MKKAILCSLTIGLALALTTTAQALTLSWSPSSQLVPSGTPASVDLIASDIGGSLTSFSFDVTYDPVLLTATSVVYGPHLAPAITTGTGLVSPGVFNVGQFSVGFPFPVQPSSFSLFTLTFDTHLPSLPQQTSALGISFNPFAGQGVTVNGIPTIPTIEQGSITPTPEPQSFLLLGAGLVGIIAWRRKVTAQA